MVEAVATMGILEGLVLVLKPQALTIALSTYDDHQKRCSNLEQEWYY